MITVVVDNLDELQIQYDLTVKEIETAMRRAMARSLSKLRTFGYTALAQDPKISTKKARSRVLTSKKYPNNLFFGADETVANPPLSVIGRKPKRKKQPRRKKGEPKPRARKNKYGRGGRPVSINGVTIPGAWARLKGDSKGTQDRYHRIPFQRINRKAIPVFADIHAQVRDAFNLTEEQVDEIFETMFQQEFKGQVDFISSQKLTRK